MTDPMPCYRFKNNVPWYMYLTIIGIGIFEMYPTKGEDWRPLTVVYAVLLAMLLLNSVQRIQVDSYGMQFIWFIGGYKERSFLWSDVASINVEDAFGKGVITFKLKDGYEFSINTAFESLKWQRFVSTDGSSISIFDAIRTFSKL